ncbi:MAG: dihydroorotase [Acidimicrobiia bacterium]|nr:MAG: dihydroorotase [Acidimicrobiia bacterium]
MSDLVLSGGSLLTEDGLLEADVRIADGVIVEIGSGLDAETLIECDGAWVGPGFVDLHSHLREPGEEWKEDISSGSAAAAAGGYTAVVTMPNTDPAVDAGHLARFIADRGATTGLVDVMPAGAVSMGRHGEQLAHLDELWQAGVRLFTDDGNAVADAGLMRQAMDYLATRGGVIAQHALDPGLAAAGQLHEGVVSSLLGMPAIPAEAEEIIIARDLRLAELTGARYHVQHLSTAGGVEMIAAAKARGLDVSAEVTPHHLAFDDSTVARTDPTYKVMPPLRSAEHRDALRAGLRDGTIDAVATDHAPHAAHDKDVPFEHAASGITGLEWAAAVVNTVAPLDPVSFYTRMAVAPAAIAGMPEQGRWVAVGGPAHLAVFDPVREWVPERTVSRSSNTPYLGMTLRGRVVATVYRGTVTARSGSPAAVAPTP